MYVGANFPRQIVGESEKTKKWYKDHADVARFLIGYENDNGFRLSMGEKQNLYNMHYGKVDPSDFKKVADPLGIDASFADNVENYPFVKPKINVLVGEEINMEFDFYCLLLNEDAITEKEDTRLKEIEDYILKDLSKITDEKTLSKRLEYLDKTHNLEFQDIREKRANMLLKYLYNQLGMRFTYNRGFEDFCVAGEQLYKADVWNGEPVFLKLDPLSTYILRSNNTPYLEDCTAIIEDTYETPNRLLDMYGDELKPADIKKIEQCSGLESIGDGGIAPPAYMISDALGVDPQGSLILDIGGNVSVSPDSYDGSGKIRRTTLTWLGLRKMKEVTYFDKQTGVERIKYMPEMYELDKEAGETSRTVWWNEWHEVTKISDDIYVRHRPKPVQFRGMIDNRVKSGFVGIVNNTNMGKTESLWAIAKPYQYLYNEFMQRVKLAFAKHFGPMLEVDFAKKPDGWSEDQWFWFMRNMNIIVTDSFKVGSKGAATGTLAGNLGQTNFSVKNADMGGVIRDYIDMLNFIDNQCSTVLGVPPQRLGEIKERELVRNVQVVKQQSMNVTKKLFDLHENVKIRGLQAVLEVAKYAYKKNPRKLQFMMDDKTTALIKTDDGFLDEDYGVFIASQSSGNIAELRETMKQIQLAAFQNGQGNMALLIDTFLNTSLQDIKRKYEEFERKRIEREDQQHQDMVESENKRSEVLAEVAKMKEQTELEKAEIAAESQRYVADINAQTKIATTGDDGDMTEKDVELIRLKYEEQREKRRSNLVKERQNDEKLQIQEKQANKPVKK